ncbi:MAG: hypothetical protein ACR2J4_04920 [Deinococcus sp.]
MTVRRLWAPFPAALLPAALLAAALGACAPATRSVRQAPLAATTAVSRVSFYPAQAGLSWNYVPEGDPPDSPPYTLRALGPAIFGTKEAQAYALTGRGAEQTSYRLVSGSGVQLIGFRKPGLSVRLDPPWQEYPAESAWKVGLAWQGESAITVQSDDGKVTASGKVTYRYAVLDQRTVKVAGKGYTVWVVSRQITDTVGGLFPGSQELWFAPFVGEVRSPEGLLLTARNFTGGQP